MRLLDFLHGIPGNKMCKCSSLFGHSSLVLDQGRHKYKMQRRAITPLRGMARDETFRTELDENAPPTPSVGDEIPATSEFGSCIQVVSSRLTFIDTRMIGALAVCPVELSSRRSTNTM